jgi:hypothetical protein
MANMDGFIRGFLLTNPFNKLVDKYDNKGPFQYVRPLEDKFNEEDIDPQVLNSLKPHQWTDRVDAMLLRQPANVFWLLQPDPDSGLPLYKYVTARGDLPILKAHLKKAMKRHLFTDKPKGEGHPVPYVEKLFTRKKEEPYRPSIKKLVKFDKKAIKKEINDAEKEKAETQLGIYKALAVNGYYTGPKPKLEKFVKRGIYKEDIDFWKKLSIMDWLILAASFDRDMEAPYLKDEWGETTTTWGDYYTQEFMKKDIMNSDFINLFTKANTAKDGRLPETWNFNFQRPECRSISDRYRDWLWEMKEKEKIEEDDWVSTTYQKRYEAFIGKCWCLNDIPNRGRDDDCIATTGLKPGFCNTPEYKGRKYEIYKAYQLIKVDVKNELKALKALPSNRQPDRRIEDLEWYLREDKNPNGLLRLKYGNDGFVQKAFDTYLYKQVKNRTLREKVGKKDMLVKIDVDMPAFEDFFAKFDYFMLSIKEFYDCYKSEKGCPLRNLTATPANPQGAGGLRTELKVEHKYNLKF